MRPRLVVLSILLQAALPAWGADAPPGLSVTLPAQAAVFELCEARIGFPEALAARLQQLPQTQVHDAYDADRDGIYVRLWAEFKHASETRLVPGFAMREAPGAPWRWRVRFSPRYAGAYQVSVHAELGFGKDAAPAVLASAPALLTTVRGGVGKGPLIAPQNAEQPALLRELQADGTSRAAWLFGACRAWVSEVQDPHNDWSPHEWLDRESELLEPMRAHGYNLLNQWMAPWEFLIVHHDRAEFWRQGGGKEKGFKRLELPKQDAWSPYQCLDQGRAAAFDELLKQCEGDDRKSTIYLLLSPLPHQCLQVKEHPWGSQESGWSPANDAGKQSLERLNGFSAFKPDKPEAAGAPAELSVWDFFEADPALPVEDWRCRLFDHQANYWRYLIARWGYSRALGVWVLVDELDAVGDVVGSRKKQIGWWGHPACERWLGNVVRLFRGQLKRADGLQYAGDPFSHPLHAATTSFGGQAGRGGNIDWEGGPAGARPDLFGFHWYPSLRDGADWTEIWSYTIDGVSQYARAPIGAHPRLISEFGASDRERPGDAPSALYPTLFHHAAWASIFSGQAGTPLDWDDGKQFGEMTWRKRKGAFDQEHYPIDNAAQIAALRKFLDPLPAEHLRPCGGSPGAPALAAGAPALGFALYDIRSSSVYGWCFSSGESAKLTLTGLKPGTYRLTWFDPWTGSALPDSKTNSVKKGENLDLDAAPVLKKLRADAAPFPEKSRQARGQDAAFALEAQ